MKEFFLHIGILSCILLFTFSTTESEDVYPKPRVNNSMETDDYFSSEGSQASSTEDCKAHEDDFLFSLDEPNIETDLFSMPFV